MKIILRVILKVILLLLIPIFAITSCSSYPRIETRHRVIPSKKYSTAAPMGSSPQVSVVDSQTAYSSGTLVISDSITSGTQVADGVVTPMEKPRSTITYPTDASKIGALLPMTGRFASLGQRVLNSIQIALSGSTYSVIVYDTQSNSDLAARGVEKLLKEQNVIAILGGLSAKEAIAISDKAEFFEVPYFSFSQKSGLTDETDYTFRNAVTPAMQVERLVEYALTHLNAKRFAVLYPNDPYGVEFANTYWDMVLAGGGEITAAQVYDAKDNDLNPYIQKMLGTFHIEPRLQEYKERKKELADKKRKSDVDKKPKKKNSRENESTENILSSMVNFDVLFIPDGGRSLGQVMAFMKNNDVTEMTYLGTNLWNTSDLGRRAGHSAKNIFFVDATLSPEDEQKSPFYQKYYAAFNESPTIIEAQAFEAAKILRDQISSGYRSRSSLSYQLKSMGRTLGAYSEIRMNTNHELVRPLNLFELSSSIIKKID